MTHWNGGTFPKTMEGKGVSARKEKKKKAAERPSVLSGESVEHRISFHASPLNRAPLPWSPLCPFSLFKARSVYGGGPQYGCLGGKARDGGGQAVHFFSPQILLVLITWLRSQMVKGGDRVATSQRLLQIVILEVSWSPHVHVSKTFESWSLNLVLLFPSQFCSTGRMQNAEV